VTGISFNSAPINPKRLELLHELLPRPSVVAALMDARLLPLQSDELVEAARALGQQIVMMKVASESEIDAAFDTIVQARANAVFVGSSAFFVSRRRQIIALAARHALPASYTLREFVEGGGLMSYGASDLEAYRRAGTYVARILKGEKPGEIPVELPTRYELVFNLATAKALKFDIPAKLLALADEVIE
jgi:putative ABC transport system substrate-binding protein